MNYSELTDFEINKLVAEKEFLLKGGGFSEFDEKDYCNNPSDAWPIILENKISLVPVHMKNKWIAEHMILDCEGCIHFECEFTDKNPLRAAMIVYMMGDE